MNKSAYKIATVLLVGAFVASGYTTADGNNSYDDSTIEITDAVGAYATQVVNTTPAYSQGTMVSITDTLENVVVNETAAVDTTTTDTNTVDTEAKTDALVKYPQFIGILIPNVEESLNIRAEANEESERLGKLPAGASAVIVERGDQWTKIQSGSVVGYVRNDFVVTGDAAGEYAEAHCTKVAIVTTETLKVRESQDENSTCVTMVAAGDEYQVKSEENGWAQVQLDENTTGYVSEEYVNVSFALTNAISKEEEEAIAKREAEEAAAAEEAARKAAEEAEAAKKAEANKGKKKTTTTKKPSGSSGGTTVVADSGAGGRSDIANYALQFVGNPYVYGGTSLTNGADCSGFVMSVFANFGYSLPHSSSALQGVGTGVSTDALQPGDIICYSGHVGIYIGGGQIVHASSAKTGIKVSNANYKPIVAARRVG